MAGGAPALQSQKFWQRYFKRRLVKPVMSKTSLRSEKGRRNVFVENAINEGAKTAHFAIGSLAGAANIRCLDLLPHALSSRSLYDEADVTGLSRHPNHACEESGDADAFSDF